MDQSEYKYDDRKSEDWHIGIPSDISFQTLTPRILSRDQHVQLQLQKNVRSREPIIPATTLQKLFYYHTYTSSLSKTQMVFRKRTEFNKFIWYYIFNVLCKSLPSAYVYMFLGSYAPDNHFFLHKMFPIMYGCIWVFIFTAICELIFMTDYTLYCLDYVVCGLFYKVPWKRCPNKTLRIISANIEHTCCNITELKTKFVNTTIKKSKMTYLSVATNEHFNLVQFDYYYQRLFVFWQSKMGLCVTLIAMAIIWLYNAQLNQLKKVYIWKTLSKAHILLNLLLLLILFDCITRYSSSDVNIVKVTDERKRQNLIDLDINMLAESMTAPPVAHVITAKGSKDIHPSRDSGIMILSNAIHYIFRGILTVLIRVTCEQEIHAPLLFLENVDIDQVFNIWPVYFETLEYGDIYVVIFFILCSLTEFCTLIISCQCLLEAIVCEWHWIKPRCAALYIFCTSAFIKLVICPKLLVIIYCYLKSLCTLIEALILYWLYPLGRLRDDIKFHCGSSLTKLRLLSFKIVPLFYFIKMYTMLSLLEVPNILTEIGTSQTIFYLFPLIPFVLGALYAAYYYKIKIGRSWLQLFKPAPEWGPQNLYSRNIRKQFDSRKCIASQAPRELSRQFIDRSRVYKLDIDYDSLRRRSRLSSYISQNGNSKKCT